MVNINKKELTKDQILNISLDEWNEERERLINNISKLINKNIKLNPDEKKYKKNRFKIVQLVKERQFVDQFIELKTKTKSKETKSIKIKPMINPKKYNQDHIYNYIKKNIDNKSIKKIIKKLKKYHDKEDIKLILSIEFNIDN
jgi:rubrerythrin